MAYLQVENLTKSYGDKTLFENINFVINKSEKVAFIAKNGTGKTSLLNILAEKDGADSGTYKFDKDISIGYLPQEPDLNPENTVIQQVFASSNNVISAIKTYEEAMLSENETLIQNAVNEMDRLNAWNYELKIKQILNRLKITDLNQQVKQLSGGQKKRLALANTLINKPNFLILDEPTNHLDFEMIEWLEEYFSKSDTTLFIVTHDRYFLDNVCSKIVELDDGKIFTYKGNYSYYLEKRAERIEILTTETEKAKKLLKKEAVWMNRMPQARATKAKSRIDAFYETKEKASKRIDNSKVNINVNTSRLGKKIIDIYNISKSFGEKILIKDFSYKFARLERIGIVGNNGTGKSTFLNVITEQIPADSGTIEKGETVVYGYYRQDGMKFSDNQKVIEAVKEIADIVEVGKGHQLSVAQFLEYFLFPRSTHYKDIATLSGGEKRRLYLLTVLMKNPNFLILDEPTNDLDIMTLNVLEDYLQNFAGNILVVSHDRYFTDKVVDTLFVFDDKGNISHFPGNYSALREKKKQKEKSEKKVKNDSKTTKEKPKSKNKNKFSYKEKVEFEKLDEEIENLNSEKKEIENLLNSGNIAVEDFAEKSKRLSELIDLIDEKEFRWLELSEKA